MKAAPRIKRPPEKDPAGKPLAGRVFYLDIPSKVTSERLEKDIKDLGGTVEGFLSKEISCLITTKKEAKCTKALKFSCSLSSPDPSTTPGRSPAQPGSHRAGNQKGEANKKPAKDDVSRGKSLLKKVIKEQEILPKNSILANAWNWGIRVLHVDDAKIYLDKKRKSMQPVKQPPDVQNKPFVYRKRKAQKLRRPCLKVEDDKSLYQPIFLESPLLRSFTTSPWSKDAEANEAKRVEGIRKKLKKTFPGQDIESRVQEVLKEDKKRRQKKIRYCECCQKNYVDLDAHTLTERHKKFYEKESHYQDLDNLIKTLHLDFVDWAKYRQEARSSVSKPTETSNGQEAIRTKLCNQAPCVAPVIKQNPVTVPGTELEVPPEAAGYHPNTGVRGLPEAAGCHPNTGVRGLPEAAGCHPNTGVISLPEAAGYPLHTGVRAPLHVSGYPLHAGASAPLNAADFPLHTGVGAPLHAAGYPLHTDVGAPLHAHSYPLPAGGSGLLHGTGYPLNASTGAPLHASGYLLNPGARVPLPAAGYPLHPGLKAPPEADGCCLNTPAVGHPGVPVFHIDTGVQAPPDNADCPLDTGVKASPDVCACAVNVTPVKVPLCPTAPSPKQTVFNMSFSDSPFSMSPRMPNLLPEADLLTVPLYETITENHMRDDLQKPNDIPPVLTLEPFVGRAHDRTSSEAENESPCKKFRLNDTPVSKASHSKPVDVNPEIETANEALALSCLSNFSDVSSDQSPNRTSSKLRRKVKRVERKARKQEDLPAMLTCKVSVPQEQSEFSSCADRLLSLFESSEVQSDFFGFACEEYSQTKDNRQDQATSQDDVHWCSFSTSSSAGTFYGF
ncbi:protein DBF4 homolog A isoform X2 [Hyperolius riggenbachi]